MSEYVEYNLLCMCGACPYRGRERERDNEEKIKRSNIEREQMKRRERENGKRNKESAH